MLTLLLNSWDDILEFLSDLHKNGVSWGAIITALLLWSKMKRNKRFQDRDERIEGKLDALILERGITWNGHPRTSSKAEVQNLKKLYSLLRKETQSGNQRRKKLMERLKSRKLWIAVVSAILLVLKEGLDIPVDSETVLAFAGIVIAAIAGLAHVDAKVAQNGGTVSEKPTDTIGSNK